ncbi:Dyp-type peroxidase [Actinomadura alba]|uniref:Peroxidase n=1 Tax=Actinomadura alba TaxID=406431 RepID=A0ABR7LRB4_9ACTN|nr:peroxidase [Actinomadura alba]MBC6467319.1 peroxidase [Actinomadura alba]
MQPELELEDVQGLVARGYRTLPAGCFTLFGVEDPAAGDTLEGLIPRIPNAGPFTGDVALHLALTASGLRRLGLPAPIMEGFAAEFTEGMTAPHRSRFLGDTGDTDPRSWLWGGPASPRCDGMVLLYARDATLLNAQQDLLCQALRAGGLTVLAELRTLPFTDTEPFGFRDGISQPVIEGLSKAAAAARTVPAGEFVLGYPNAYGLLTDRPLLPSSADPDRLLPRDHRRDGLADLGRGGSYLVLRQLEQDVAAFHRYVKDAAGPAGPDLLAARLIGRWPSGAPLVKTPDDDPRLRDDNEFGYHRADPYGLACPIGAHIRRANPRDSLDPDPGTAKSLEINDRHRLLRRGRPYDTDGATGLYFLCLSGNLARQYEFVQHTWVNDPAFNGLSDATDPLVGPRGPGGTTFTVQARPARERHLGLPAFVRVRGGAYFFLPGIRALRYLARLPRTRGASGGHRTRARR